MGTVMVDWDRVEQLRSKGWDWERIAEDPKVGFHPDASVHDAGRALRGLYHRQKSREGRTGKESSDSAHLRRRSVEVTERVWTLPRIGYLMTPIFGVWFAPRLRRAFAGRHPAPGRSRGSRSRSRSSAFILLFGLLRSSSKRWTPVFRTTVITGVVLGLFVAGPRRDWSGYLAFGCPYLPPAEHPLVHARRGWTHASVIRVAAGRQTDRLLLRRDLVPLLLGE